MTESRPSPELMQAGELPPCVIDAHGETPVRGTACDGDLVEPQSQDVDAHQACAGWWEDTHRKPGAPPGFRCSCECHAGMFGWPGWDRYLSLAD